MECKVCKVAKLSDEYPPTTLTDSCKHGVFECLRCTIKAAEVDGKCAHVGCNGHISTEEDDLNLRWFKAIIDRKFKFIVEEPKETMKKSGQEDDVDQEPFLKVIMVDGSQIRVPYQRDMEIFVLKEHVKEKTKIELNDQKLMFNGKVLESLIEHRRIRLSEYQIEPMSSLYLAKILIELTGAIEHITFKIDWGYPESRKSIFFNLIKWTSSKKDYLDASCLLYSLGPDRMHKHEFTVNHKFPEYKDAIKHSGDVLDEKKKRGQHTLTLELQKLPPNITHLFFTLSSRLTDTLKNYKDPKLEVQNNNEDKPLTETSMGYGRLFGSSVIVCCLYLSEDKRWRVMDLRRPSNGKVDNYAAIERVIDRIFKDVFCYTLLN